MAMARAVSVAACFATLAACGGAEGDAGDKISDSSGAIIDGDPVTPALGLGPSTVSVKIFHAIQGKTFAAECLLTNHGS